MNLKNPKDLEAEEKLEEEIEASQQNEKTDDVQFYDQQVFDENIDDIDFDKIGVEDD